MSIESNPLYERVLLLEALERAVAAYINLPNAHNFNCLKAAHQATKVSK